MSWTRIGILCNGISSTPFAREAAEKILLIASVKEVIGKMLDLIELEGRHVVRVEINGLSMPIGSFENKETALRAARSFGEGIVSEATNLLLDLHGERLNERLNKGKLTLDTEEEQA